jgi:hypothetical protein
MILDNFKQHCIQLNSDVFVQKHLIEDKTFIFSEIKKGEEFNFKKDIASILSVHIRDIIIVGSGKFGFSLKPDKDEAGLYLFKEFDYNFKNQLSDKKSDLDIAIVSSHLFDKEIENLYNYTGFHKNFMNKQERSSFGFYVLKGRLAIRFLPLEFKLTKEIIKVQEKYKMMYGREINLEIYKSWHYFETYHKENIKNIQVNLIA